MKYEFTTTGFNELYTILKQLPVELTAKNGGPVKLALRKAAMVIRDEELRRFRELVDEKGKPDSTGLIEKSIVVKRAKQQDVLGERYIITFRRYIYLKGLASQSKKVGTGAKLDIPTTRKTAQLFEYGSSHQPPRPFIRPAFAAKAGEAIEVFKQDLSRRIGIIVRRIERQNKGKK